MVPLRLLRKKSDGKKARAKKNPLVSTYQGRADYSSGENKNRVGAKKCNPCCCLTLFYTAERARRIYFEACTMSMVAAQNTNGGVIQALINSRG